MLQAYFKCKPISQILKATMHINTPKYIIENFYTIWRGFMIALLVAIAAQFVSDHYGAPAMLMALLMGIALNFISQDSKCKAGIEFSARTILRLGIALLGLQVSLEMLSDLGIKTLFIVIASVLVTIFFGIAIAPLFKHRLKFAFLSSGSVAICGASAALAISAALPKDDRSEERLVFTVVGVTVLSTISMIAYPILGSFIGFDNFSMGIFLGATIHDVAQVIGAGFSVSNQTGEVATAVKLIRVSMLAPVVTAVSVIIWLKTKTKLDSSKSPPLLPAFVLSFVLLAVLNSIGLVPKVFTNIAEPLSRWSLIIAVAALGMQTSLKDITKVGGSAITLLLLQTIFLGCFVVAVLVLTKV